VGCQEERIEIGCHRASSTGGEESTDTPRTTAIRCDRGPTALCCGSSGEWYAWILQSRDQELWATELRDAFQMARREQRFTLKQSRNPHRERGCANGKAVVAEASIQSVEEMNGSSCAKALTKRCCSGKAENGHFSRSYGIHLTRARYEDGCKSGASPPTSFQGGQTGFRAAVPGPSRFPCILRGAPPLRSLNGGPRGRDTIMRAALRREFQ
jgi:hypothetical protein